MSTFSEYRTLPSGLELARHTTQHGMEVEDTYILGQTRITREEYDALYPLSRMNGIDEEVEE